MSVVIWLDTETGGLSARDHDLLTCALVVRDSAQRVTLDTLALKISRPAYRTVPQAMDVNQLDLAELRRTGDLPHVAGRRITDFLKHWSAQLGGAPLVLGGHNLPFDLRFLQAFLGEVGMQSEFDRLTDHTILDTKVVAKLLRDREKFVSKSLSLQPLVQALGLPAPDVGQAHQAEYDALQAAYLYEKLSDLLLGNDCYVAALERLAAQCRADVAQGTPPSAELRQALEEIELLTPRAWRKAL